MTVQTGQVEAELEKILHSRIFHGAKLLSGLLRFIVEESIAGHSGSLKESGLGIAGRGLGAAFDPRMNAAVRVDARRLRAKLAEYYGTEGRHDQVLIEVPKGRYAPVFSLRDSTEAPIPVAQGRAPGYLTSRQSVAVLPFVSLSADPENQYLADSLTEEVIVALTRISGLRVIGRSTVYWYEGKALDARRVGRDLNVGMVVEGSVRRTGKHLRIKGQLLDASNWFRMWAGTWEREATDIFAIPQEISAEIGSIIAEHLSPVDQKQPRAAVALPPPDRRSLRKISSTLNGLMSHLRAGRRTDVTH